MPDPREMVRDLMRGSRPDMTQGDTGPHAVLVACGRCGVDGPEALELLAYAYGFAVGLNDDWIDLAGFCEGHAQAIREGWIAGLDEDRAAAWPVGVGERATREPAR